MLENQKVLCDKCGFSEFEYDSYWKEYSCKRCGWLVEDAEKISGIKSMETELVNRKQAEESEDIPVKQCTVAPDIDSLAENKDVEGLIKALEYEEDDEVVFKAVIALGIFGDERAIEPLFKLLTHPDLFVRVYSAGSLGLLGDKRAVERLINAMSETNLDIRKYAIETLGKLGEMAFEPLVKTLKHSDPSVRGQAANALGLLGDIRAIERLRELGDQDKDLYVKVMAKTAIGMIQERASKVHRKKGDDYFSRREFDRASQEYKEALEIAPMDADLHHNLGAVYASQGKFDEAIDEYQTALNINPNLDDTRRNLEKAREAKR